MKVAFIWSFFVCFIGNLRSFNAFIIASKLRCSGNLALMDTKDKNDFIDAEIVKSGDLSLPKLPGIFSTVKGKVSSAISKLTTKKESNDKLSQQKKEMNGMIDKAFQGTGLLGGVVGTIAKQVGSLVVDNLAQSANDFEKVQESIQNRIELNDRALNVLGETSSLGFPLTSSMSTTNINGEVTKKFYYILPVAGDRGSGQVTAQGTMDTEGRVIFRTLVLRTLNGSINLAGGTGDGRGSSGKVIDVEIV